MVYKAGRYGIAPSTAKILKSLGFCIDASLVPHTSFTRDGGPDFRGLPDRPFWFGDELDLLEVPLTRGFAGLLSPCGPVLYPLMANRIAETLRIPALCARLGLLERITLTPEGISCAELCRLTRALLKRGQKIFCLTYHSSSLLPGGAPYVANEAQRKAFLDTMDKYFETFVGYHQFQPTTLQALFESTAQTSGRTKAGAGDETPMPALAHSS